LQARRWWTGEDSNLRSPQGAADLQSAGFSHSPTRPAYSSGTQPSHPHGEDRNTKRARVRRHQPLPNCREKSVRLTAKLSGPSIFSWRRELNPRPSDYKSDALPAELRQRTQTEQKYHKGIRIASKFLLQARRVPLRDPEVLSLQ
jgi:hypothetical protein